MKILELMLWLCGAVLIVSYAGMQVRGEVLRIRGVASFEQEQQMSGTIDRVTTTAQDPETTQEEPRARPPADSVIGIVRLPSTNVEVPVRYGTGANVLSAGAGVVEGTAMPGDRGNVAIAAHRDSFFRGLEQLAVGDVIELETLNRRLAYRVVDLSVVNPTDVQVLADTGDDVLTLITCYPFRFVGSAPQRFIVRALAVERSQPANMRF